HSFEERPRFGRALLAEQTLAEMRARIDILGVPLERRPVTGFGFGELALLEINIAELGMVMRFIEVMNLRFQLLDPPAAVSAWQFEAAGGRPGAAIDIEVVPKRREPPANEDEKGPKPFALANRIHQHPDLEDEDEDGYRRPQEEPGLNQVG